MSLDDRSLREHLDRRAHAGAVDPEALADAVTVRVSTTPTGPWWRRLRIGSPVAGLAAAAAVVLLVGITVLPGRLGPGPGASPTESAPSSAVPSAVPSTGYPGGRSMTAAELGAFMAGDPATWATITIVADVELFPIRGLCIDDAVCAVYWIPGLDGGTNIGVWDTGGVPIQGAPYGFKVRADGSLDVVGSVRPGPTGLAWTIPEVLHSDPYFRAADEPSGLLYLIDAVQYVSSGVVPCPMLPAPVPLPDFSCAGGSWAWLIATGAPLPTDPMAIPQNAIRVPNVTALRLRSDAMHQRGYYLIDPIAPSDECFLCPPAGAADLVGAVLPFAELGFDPGLSPAPTAKSSAPVPVSCDPQVVSALTCERAVAAADALLGPGWTFNHIEFYFGGYCPPNARCPYVRPDRGFVIFRTGPGLSDLLVSVSSNADGVVTAQPPIPLPSPPSS